MSDTYKKEYTILGIGDAGCWARAPSLFSDTSASITIYDKRLSCYYGDVVEGGIVIDKRPCTKRDDFVHSVCICPLLKESLPNSTKQDWNNQLIPCTDARSATSMEYISLDLYLNFWESLGARIGTRVGDEIVWRDGSKVAIRPESQRWLFGVD